MIECYEWREAPNAQFAVIGDPVEHSWSPRMQQAAFNQLGLKFKYLAIRVPVGEFDEAMAHLTRLGFLGLNVTVPLKDLAFDWAREVDDVAQRTKSVNTVSMKDARGTSTDGLGFVDTLSEFGVTAPGRIMVMGAGGAARSICASVLGAGFEVTLWNRTEKRARSLEELLGHRSLRVVSSPDPIGAAVIVNATSAGIEGDTPPLQWERAERTAIAYDLLYASEPTTFMKLAIGQSLRAIDGRFMLAAQGARSLEWWLGIEAPRSAMLEAIV